MSGSGSAVTIQGKLGAVSMLRRSTAQKSGVKPWVSSLLTDARLSTSNDASS
jgi:hypothetical protein